MANLTITNNDAGGIVFGDPTYRQELLTLAGADVIAAGTILARKVVADSVTVTPNGGNTGNGTCTLASVGDGPDIPAVGNWNLECIAAVTNGGTFKLEDPAGQLVTADLVMVAGAGQDTAFEVAGLKFTLTDGSTDFIVGDKFALAVAANGKLVLFATDGAGGAQFPKAILTVALTVTAGGDFPIAAMVAGKIRKDKLIIDADGDASNVTNAILDQLRDYGIVAVDVNEVMIADNQ